MRQFRNNYNVTDSLQGYGSSTILGLSIVINAVDFGVRKTWSQISVMPLLIGMGNLGQVI